MKIQLSAFCLLASIFYLPAFAQNGDTNSGDYSNLSLKDLLNVKIVSVSKSSESLFDAPLSASVVTREDIRKSGATSIMEALRLVPGMIVREQSNGNYDIHLRGMDNVPPYSTFDVTSNTTTLVMIDNRVIYSYLRGGTFWETLPIDINDVEKIEVVRGPAAALYGPNAVNGVIHIITRTAGKEGLYAVANAQKGSRTSIANASVGYKLNKWGLIASGNYQHRQRFQTSYFEFNRDRWIDQPPYFINFNDDTVRNLAEHFPDQNLAMKKYAGNVFISFDPKEKAAFRLSAGTQYSRAQKVSTENEITPLSLAGSGSSYVSFHADVKNLSAQLSYNSGTQFTDYAPGNKYDFIIADAAVEYNYSKGPLSIKPGFSYKAAIYDDTKYSDIANKSGMFNNRGKITTGIASVRGEYKLLNNKLRLVGGLAANHFNYPDTTNVSYQLAATYKLTGRHVFRAVYSEAPRSSNVFDTYVNQTVAYFPSGINRFTRIALEGNKNLRMLTASMVEAGYRFNSTSSFSVDVEMFSIHGKNFNTLVNLLPYTQMAGADTIQMVPLISTNLPLQLVQKGLTASVSWKSNKLELNPFVTVQKTVATNFYPSNMGFGPASIYAGMGSKTTFKSTPAVYGGATANYSFARGFTLNLNCYYYSSQTYGHLSYLLFNDGTRGIDHIPSKLLINATVSYRPLSSLDIFLTGKNILDKRSREFFRTDVAPAGIYTGLNYQF